MIHVSKHRQIPEKIPVNSAVYWFSEPNIDYYTPAVDVSM
jgi:hypothetical protein